MCIMHFIFIKSVVKYLTPAKQKNVFLWNLGANIFSVWSNPKYSDYIFCSNQMVYLANYKNERVTFIQ